jgi:hypothetical protein
MALPEFRYTTPVVSGILNHYYGHGRNTMKNGILMIAKRC